MKRMLQNVRKNSPKLWTVFLLLYSFVILAHQILGSQTSLVFYIPFLIFVPGYAVAKVLFRHIQRIEIIAVSLAISIAILASLKSIMETFRITGIFSEITVTVVLAIVCLVAALVKQLRS